MDLNKISIGHNPPWDVNVVIEIPYGSSSVKYEFDKDLGMMCVDRFLHTSMYYPANYGFIPHTLGGDGDPLDALVVGDVPVIPGAIIRSRPLGVLLMEDENGKDEKIIMSPVEILRPYYGEVISYLELPDLLVKRIEHFFKHYKDLDKEKWVKILGWQGEQEAAKLIKISILK